MSSAQFDFNLMVSGPKNVGFFMWFPLFGKTLEDVAGLTSGQFAVCDWWDSYDTQVWQWSRLFENSKIVCLDFYDVERV